MNIAIIPPPHFNLVVPDEGEQICLVSLEVTNHQHLPSRPQPVEHLLKMAANYR